MAKITVEDLYSGDKYNIIGNSFKDFWLNHQGCADEITTLFHLTVKHSVAATIKMIDEGDFIDDYQSELKSLSALIRR